MASISGDETPIQECDESVRRTRSGRSSSFLATVTPTTRSTRRSSRYKSSDIEATEQSIAADNIGEIPEEKEEEEEVEEDVEKVISPASIDTQSIYAEDDKSSSMNTLYEQSSPGVPNIQQLNTESNDNFLATLAEDNANSLPSVCDEKIAHSSIDVRVRTNRDVDAIEESASDSSSLQAISDDIPNGNSQDTKVSDSCLDAEMVSEDELPAPVQPKVDDAEEVSDEELPGPKLAELPADAEMVSEEELPANKSKRKNQGPDDTENANDTPNKRARPDATENATNASAEDGASPAERKMVPELEKYWTAVRDNPSDFTGWTYLLQYVEQENDIDAARDAYDAFLAHYPYCYGYWRKYADYEKRKGDQVKCDEVFDRGLKAIPLSVDLWIHYMTHVKQNYAEDDVFVRSQFERALATCGLEFRSDKLWEAYIRWETDGMRLVNVLPIYDKLLMTPTQGFNNNYTRVQEFINGNAVAAIITADEFKQFRTEVRLDTQQPPDDDGIAPGEDEPDDHVRDEAEAAAIKEKVLAVRRKIHKNNVEAVKARWTFEEGIKRPYFHVKPLERCQLKNWRDYLEYEMEQGDQRRVLVLFERCLIACALYDEFWLKLIHYLEKQPRQPAIVDKLGDVFERACSIHHPDKPTLHLLWSAFEEQNGNAPKAAAILAQLEKVCPNVLQVAYRRINLERRRGNTAECDQLYESYATNAKNAAAAANFAIKYARFSHKIKGDWPKAMAILQSAHEKDPNNARIVLQMIDLALQRIDVNETEVVRIIDDYLARDIDIEQQVLFAQRKVEFLEDFGSSALSLQEAQRALQAAIAKANEAKKKAGESPQKKSSKDTAAQPTAATTTPATTTGTTSTTYNNSYYSSANNSAYYGNSQYGTQAYNDTYGYNQQQWQQYSSGYGNYGQWSGYGSSGYY